ncbi:MAG: 6-phosphogluconate dehydrogenase [Maribacter sp.]|uniref:6-phosphogluconate dehydrogenase n=1 Tax=Maribacter sp. TaxID=1897614 RepID=UPI003C715752
MKKILVLTLTAIIAVFLLIYAFIYFVPYSEGVRSGELIKISRKGVLTKTWEGEISQGISGAQIFAFSVLDTDKEAIEKLKEYQGEYVKLEYMERYATFFWLGDTKYFVTKVEKEQSPHFR